ncbi:ribonuclease HII [Prochlorococcus sp. MIT 1223]|uniref:ribonuclease HII n=1 Tax=Prochlorococcus sp. MIT 1223 TaxID=3096217 RepID=UPI002A7488FB|nr:ribonuclease HII [Prochlorococcus sp. MIT 1223]
MVYKNAIVLTGVDEVGRGSLFGPVFACAVVLGQANSTRLIKLGLKDSKKLSKLKISKLAPIIKTYAEEWGVGQSSAKEIDKTGIRKATEIAMIRALQKLAKPPDLVLIDGCLNLRGWEGKQKTIIKGDDSCPAIAAASVIAKNSRDELIKRLSKKYPKYGLQKNVGYGTAFHRQALSNYGPTDLHRLSFIKKFLG